MITTKSPPQKKQRSLNPPPDSSSSNDHHEADTAFHLHEDQDRNLHPLVQIHDQSNHIQDAVGFNKLAPRPGAKCPYMDTVNRKVLDFDFERVCSVSLDNHNVYACLICGKYFQGRGKKTHAYFHSLESQHHIFINLETERVYCLPDGYEIIDSSLDDIKSVLNPKFTKEQVASLDSQVCKFRTLDGEFALQGIIGLNNLHSTDYINVVLQALAVVKPLRDFFLLYKESIEISSVAFHLGDLFRRMFNPRPFKNHVSPHEMVQDIFSRSSRRFKILEQGNPVELMAWLLNTLNKDLCNKKNDLTIIQSTFAGNVKIVTQKDAVPGQAVASTETSESQFFFLSLDLPPRPLFKDASERNTLQQYLLQSLLTKFNGHSKHHIVRTGEQKSYIIRKLPKYLIFHVKRFTKNNFYLEKNPAVVHFPARNLDMKYYIDSPEEPTSAQYPGCSTKYDLVAAIMHEGEPKGGTYSASVLHRATMQWFEIQDLNIKETLPQLISLAEAHVMIYEAQESTKS